MKPLAASIVALTFVAALAAAGSGQTAAPAATTPPPWHPRPVIIIDPRTYLATPSPAPRQAAKRATPWVHGTPHRRPATVAPTPETFERHDTSPPPRTPGGGLSSWRAS